MVVVDGVRTVGRRSTLAAANLHESLADEFVVGTAELDVVHGLGAPRTAAAVATTSRTVLETKRLLAATLAVVQVSRLTGTPRTATLHLAVR